MSELSGVIHVGNLSVGFSENRLPRTSDLNGKKLTLSFENGNVFSYEFIDEHLLNWKITEGPDSGLSGLKEEYRGICPRENIYFLDSIRKRDRATTISLILDFDKGIATSLTGTLPDIRGMKTDNFGRLLLNLRETGVEAKFESATIDHKFEKSSPRHESTREMLGKSVRYTYSSKNIYQHFYERDDYFTWQCQGGIEKGLQGTDRCHHFKIAQDLYFFVWREIFPPTLGVVMVNLQSMRSAGKIFGYEGGDFQQLSNFPVGSFATLMT